jgi:hypothetical protein
MCGLEENDPGSRICSVDMVTGHNLGKAIEGDEAQNLIIERQRQYAEANGYSYNVFSENCATECVNLQGESEKCDPQWSKISIIRNWLEEPKNPCDGESWLAWLDPDVIMTNYSEEGRLEYLIGGLGDGGRFSTVVTNDYCSTETLDTGAIFVRHDAVARELMRHIWEARNEGDGAGARWTLGICGQSCSHEREAMERIFRHHHWIWEVFDYVNDRSIWPSKNTVVIIPNRVLDLPGINTVQQWQNLTYWHLPSGASVAARRRYMSCMNSSWKEGDFSGRCPPEEESGRIPLDCINHFIGSSD